MSKGMDAITAEVVNEVVSNPMSPRAVSDYVKAKAEADDGTAKDLPSILAAISQESIAREQERTHWKSRWRLSVALGILAVIVTTSIQFAISFASNQLSKESFVNENAQLTDKHGEVVQTVLAHSQLENPDWNVVRQLDAGSLGRLNSITFSLGSDMEVFKINGVRIANADVPEERTVTFLSPYGTIIASKDSIALNHLDGRRLAYGAQRRLKVKEYYTPFDHEATYYDRITTPRFWMDTDDIFMRSLIKTYALEERQAKTTPKPEGKMTLTTPKPEEKRTLPWARKGH